ncbi:MAG: carbon-nitrogen hydrolase family protein [Candidatus Brocadiia bacterium]
MPQQFTVAAGQFAPVKGQPQKNAVIAATLGAQASDLGADFILFPEMIITGHDKAEQDLRPTAISLDHPAIDTLRDASGQYNIAISAGIVEHKDDHYWINQLVTLTDGSLSFQRKGCAPDGEDWRGDDNRHLIEINGLTLCLMICADSSQPHLWQRVEKLSPDLVCHPSAGYDWWIHEDSEPDPDKLRDEHAKMYASIQTAQKRARQLDCAYIISNPVGSSKTVWWPGNSGIIDRDGAVVAWLPGEIVVERMRPGFVVGNITLAS